ncbi:LysM peptidoglycan-binding domain-containing protein [Halobacillus sp. A1]|uniref:LysM peptidoglycan-binding domain-containing protein n=1 Tax=Halobacillus sp. A1 TaxID=2880262 RepID=UPI0020A68971|nr:LysM peptidoglycan-binding domain-containing protein [Halobacillus sp. A1]MCP3033047.1 LysM peptidoglycan-binding domain-containing protein [Halobacillus sp. A1]
MPIENSTHYIYTVQPGDTLYSIARRFGSEVSDIEQANALYPPITDPGLIYPGQILLVSKQGPNQTYQIVSPGETLNQYARRFSSSVDLLFGINPQLGDPNYIYPNQVLLVPAFVYEIEQGDTLNKIAQRFGISLASLLEANRQRPGIGPDVIYPGSRLILPLPSSYNIVVSRPFPGTQIREGQKLAGFARAFEGSILYQIKDDEGNTVTNEAPIQASAGGPAYGTFSESIVFDEDPASSAGEIWVYTRSANDNSVQDLVQVRVLF